MVEEVRYADAALVARSLLLGYRVGKPVAGPMDLTVRCGELVLLKGPNGSGKSTFLKTVAGLVRPIGGYVFAPDAVLIPTRVPKVKGFTVFDFVKTFLSFSEKRVYPLSSSSSTDCNTPSSRKKGSMSSWVIQSVEAPSKKINDSFMSGCATSADIDPYISEAEVAYPDMTSLKKTNRKEISPNEIYPDEICPDEISPSEKRRPEINDILEAMGIGDLAGRDISTLSDGQFQKVCLCPAIASGKHLILLDEPTAFLDAYSRIQLMEFLSELTKGKKSGLNNSTGRFTVVFSSHDLAACTPYCDQIVDFAPKTSDFL